MCLNFEGGFWISFPPNPLSVWIWNSFLDGLASMKNILSVKMHNTDVKTTAVLKTVVLLKYSQFVLPKHSNGVSI